MSSGTAITELSDARCRYVPHRRTAYPKGGVTLSWSTGFLYGSLIHSSPVYHIGQAF